MLSYRSVYRRRGRDPQRCLWEQLGGLTHGRARSLSGILRNVDDRDENQTVLLSCRHVLQVAPGSPLAVGTVLCRICGAPRTVTKVSIGRRVGAVVHSDDALVFDRAIETPGGFRTRAPLTFRDPGQRRARPSRGASAGWVGRSSTGVTSSSSQVPLRQSRWNAGCRQATR
jgi:hypothetical protein